MVDGAVSLQNNFGAWSIAAGCCGWIPSGMRHSLDPLTTTRTRTLYIRPTAGRRLPRTCAVLRVSPLLAALIDHVCKLEVLRKEDAAARRLAAVLVDQIAMQRELPLFVPALRMPLTQKVASLLLADPADTPRIRELAAALGVSDRTIERAFVADALMTIGEWRHRARMARAIALLAAGGGVKDVALEIGYETPSAFVTAFKKTMGITPGKIG